MRFIFSKIEPLSIAMCRFSTADNLGLLRTYEMFEEVENNVLWIGKAVPERLIFSRVRKCIH